jgi:FtsP/CotA-like multicopper oxidase with cupredoxin domain
MAGQTLDGSEGSQGTTEIKGHADPACACVQVAPITLQGCGEHKMKTDRRKIRSQFAQRESRTRHGGLLARCAGFAALCLVAISCLASDGGVPNILANNNRMPAGQLNSGVFTLHLELREGIWHPEAGDGRAIPVYSFAEEGHDPITPGPLIRVPRGTELHISVHNRLRFAVAVHGLHQHPGSAADYMELALDETKEARFPAGEPGSYFYWASTLGGKADRRSPASDASLEARHLDEGLMSGTFIVDKQGSNTNDRIFVIQVWAKGLFTSNFVGILSINGKSWPYTERLRARLGQPEHWRIVNVTPFVHPMHLHGFYFYVDAVSDGETEHSYIPAERRMVVTEPVHGGHTFDMTWLPERVGNWIFHCHILDHMMGDYKSPVLYGPDGPTLISATMRHEDDPTRMGMGELVMGITVNADNAHLVAAKVAALPLVAERHLYARERPASPYVPAGPSFFLEGVSKDVEPIGPPLVITRGERTAITVHNELKEATAIHWHGLEIESYYDGVPLWAGTSQHATPYIAPGDSFTAFITPPRAGTFIYHTHWNDVRQLTGGMYGALLVLEPRQKYDPVTDKVFVIGRAGVNEMRDPLVLNGSPQPGLMVLLAGQTYCFRFINITPNDGTVRTSLILEDHPAKWRALAKDGAELPPPQATLQDAVKDVSVGETYDFEFAPTEPGDYALTFRSLLGSEVTQMIAVVPPGSAFSVYASKR